MVFPEKNKVGDMTPDYMICLLDVSHKSIHSSVHILPYMSGLHVISLSTLG